MAYYGDPFRLRHDKPPARSGEDTGLELPDATETRIELRPPAAGVDETVLEIAEADEPRSTHLSDQLQTGEDETIVFTSDDATNFVVVHEPVEREDETDLSQLGEPEDLTGTGDRGDAQAVVGDDDETDLSQFGERQDLTSIGEQADDETDLSQPRAIIGQVSIPR